MPKFKSKQPVNSLNNPFDPKEIEKRKKHLEKTFSLARQSKKITVEEVEQNLKISKEDAIRYLEHLVSFGKLVKINERGQGVFYKLSN